MSSYCKQFGKGGPQTTAVPAQTASPAAAAASPAALAAEKKEYDQTRLQVSKVSQTVQSFFSYSVGLVHTIHNCLFLAHYNVFQTEKCLTCLV